MEEQPLFLIDTAGSKGENDASEYKTPGKGRERAEEDGGSSKKLKYTQEDEEEEKRLANLLFVDPVSAIEKLGTEEGDSTEQKDDWKKSFATIVSEELNEEDEDDEQSPVKAADGSAWVDEDDVQMSLKLGKGKNERIVSGVELTNQLRRRFNYKTHQSADWAKIADESPQEEEDFLRTTESVLAKSSVLPSKEINIERMKDANMAEYASGSVLHTQFHPNSQLLFAASLDKCIRLFQIDGIKNNRVQTVRFPFIPYAAQFSQDGKEIVIGGRTPNLYVYDLMTGNANKVRGIVGRKETSWEKLSISPDNKYISLLANAGEVVLLNNQTKQLVNSFKMGAKTSAMAFTPDGHSLFCSTEDGYIYKWDLRTRRCQHKFYDNGTLSTYMAFSKNGNYLASGAENGVVNVYREESLSSKTPEPAKSLGHLTTRVNQIKFNSDSQIMAISSHKIDQSIRLVHLPSLTVFSNWPVQSDGLKKVSSIDFSPNSGYLAIGNNHGAVKLYRLAHYERA